MGNKTDNNLSAERDGLTLPDCSFCPSSCQHRNLQWICSGSAVNDPGELNLEWLLLHHVLLEVMVHVPGAAQCVLGWWQPVSGQGGRAVPAPTVGQNSNQTDLLPRLGCQKNPLGFVWVCSKGGWNEVLKSAWKAVVCCRTLLYQNVLARLGLLSFFSHKQL